MSSEWVTVPREPTEAMVEARLTTGARFGPRAMVSIWQTMLSAAPSSDRAESVERVIEDRISNYQAMRDERVEAGRDENAYALVVEALEDLRARTTILEGRRA
jgi:hypothetical protein